MASGRDKSKKVALLYIASKVCMSTFQWFKPQFDILISKGARAKKRKVSQLRAHFEMTLFQGGCFLSPLLPSTIIGFI